VEAEASAQGSGCRPLPRALCRGGRIAFCFGPYWVAKRPVPDRQTAHSAIGCGNGRPASESAVGAKPAFCAVQPTASAAAM